MKSAPGKIIDPACTLCDLSKSRTRVVPGWGDPKSQLMLVGEAPGAKEDAGGEPFIGRAGKILTEALAQAGLHRGDIYITNVVKCRPPRNRNPRKEELLACDPFLVGEINSVDPRVICCLGLVPTRALLGMKSPLRGEVGSQFDRIIAGKIRKVIISYHPAACLYNRTLKKELLRVIKEASLLALSTSS